MRENVPQSYAGQSGAPFEGFCELPGGGHAHGGTTTTGFDGTSSLA